jgi:hypothetical protein
MKMTSKKLVYWVMILDKKIFAYDTYSIAAQSYKAILSILIDMNLDGQTKQDLRKHIRSNMSISEYRKNLHHSLRSISEPQAKRIINDIQWLTRIKKSGLLGSFFDVTWTGTKEVKFV